MWCYTATVTLVLLTLTNTLPPPVKTDAPKAGDVKPANPTAPPATKVAVDTGVPAADKDNATSTNTTTPEHCAALLSSISHSGLTQNCTAHSDCMGACCTTVLLAHTIQYNFSVLPCNTPSVKINFNITDLKDASYTGDLKTSATVPVPHGNMSYEGFYETESSLKVILEKVVDITHFRLDFGVDYRILETEPLRSLFSHTLVPMQSLGYSKELCLKPTQPPKTEPKESSEDDSEMIWGVIPKEYVKDKTTLALIGTSVGLIVIIIIGLVYFVVSRHRGGFYRTYISTEENMHLTKGSDGFEPLDDSDID